MSVERGSASGVVEPARDDPWTVLGMVRWCGDYLREKGVERGRLEGELLLAEVLGLRRLDLYLQHDRPLTAEEITAFKPLLLRRARREPLQYILGRTAFRELDLKTDRRGLIPRPETEALVQEVLDWATARGDVDGPGAGLTAVDVGTGTGCIALSLALEGPFGRVTATDASGDTLDLARENARHTDLEDRIEFLQGSVYAPVAGRRFDVVVSNPPYVAESERDFLSPEILEWEPEGALFAGADGLDVLRGLVAGVAEHLAPEGLLALEIGMDQAERVVELIRATGAFAEPSVRNDLAGRPRIVLAEHRGTKVDVAQDRSRIGRE
jgi:release factor glutamine methyltransferase